jgi:hypothetical protein
VHGIYTMRGKYLKIFLKLFPFQQRISTDEKKYWWLTIPPISTKRTKTLSYYLTDHKKGGRSRHNIMEIQVLVSDKHKNVAGFKPVVLFSQNCSNLVVI